MIIGCILSRLDMNTVKGGQVYESMVNVYWA